MRVTSLRLISFRNYKDKNFTFEPSIILIHGLNGKGKTNIVEALYTAAIGKSHRTFLDEDMIHFKAEEASIAVNFIRKDVPQETFIRFPRLGRKTILFNENKISQKELLGTLNVVVFSPEDLQLTKGSPSLRRRFLDLEISQVNKAYYHQLLTYNRILQQRNKLLKEDMTKKSISLEEWDIQLAESAAFLVQKRLESLKKMNLLVGLMHRRLTGGKENLKLLYYQPYSQKEILQTKEAFYEALQENLIKDRYRMSTSIGPHRDDIYFYSDGMDLKHYGSQGQQRTAILALKLSELEFIKSEAGEYPVLLLDDVLSELDKERQKNLLDFIHRRIQTFITTTDITDFQAMKDVQFLEIKGD